MATYKTIRGLRVKYLSADPAGAEDGQVWYNSTTGKLRIDGIALAASWASGGNLGTARQRAGSLGTSQTSAMSFGGVAAPPNGTIRAESETYNGTAWSEGGNLPTGKFNISGFGTEAAGVAMDGRSGHNDPFLKTTEEYNGSAWTAVNASNTTAGIRSTSGTLTAGLAAGGFTPPSAAPAEHVNNAEEYNGTNWSNVTVMPQYQAYNCQCGTQTATLNGGGNAGPNGPTVNANAISLDYDGTNWTAGPNANLDSSNKYTAYNGGTGTQTSALFLGGEGVTTARFNGTSFSLDASVPTARGETNSAGSAPSNSALVYAGYPVPSSGNTTIEYTAASTQIKNISSS